MSLSAMQPGLRALELFDVIPAGHFGLLIRGESFAPHLRPGEIAVVDATDKERAIGELYCLTIGSGERHRLTVVDLIKGFGASCESAAAGVWFAFSFNPTAELGPGQRTRMIDGPLGFQHWPETCRGRIVGVMVPARSKARGS